MSKTQVNFDSLGGGSAEWIEGTISGNTGTFSWGYDADTIIILTEIYQEGRWDKTVAMYDLSTKDLWFSSASANWQHYGVDSRVSVSTSQSFTFNWSVSIRNLTAIPIKGKPTGYYV